MLSCYNLPMRRRDFFVSTAAATLAPAGAAFAQQPGGGKLKISAVEFWRMEGRRETVAGVNNQHQVNPIHIYDERRPQPYHEEGPGKRAMVPTAPCT